jgi:hypothetical protein
MKGDGADYHHEYFPNAVHALILVALFQACDGVLCLSALHQHVDFVDF